MNDTFFNITKLEEYSANWQHHDLRYKKLLLLLRETKEYIPTEKVEFVYTKGLLGDDYENQNLELIVFSKSGDILIVKTDKEMQKFVIDLQNADDVFEVIIRGSLTEYKYNIKREALIKFKNGKELTFHCLADSDSNLAEEYSNFIAIIIKKLKMDKNKSA